jgi:hypothetical protein
VDLFKEIVPVRVHDAADRLPAYDLGMTEDEVRDYGASLPVDSRTAALRADGE